MNSKTVFRGEGGKSNSGVVLSNNYRLDKSCDEIFDSLVVIFVSLVNAGRAIHEESNISLGLIATLKYKQNEKKDEHNLKSWFQPWEQSRICYRHLKPSFPESISISTVEPIFK